MGDKMKSAPFPVRRRACNISLNLLKTLVPQEGLEPPRPHDQQILSLQGQVSTLVFQSIIACASFVHILV
jgi:hypothetical protein